MRDVRFHQCMFLNEIKFSLDKQRMFFRAFYIYYETNTNLCGIKFGFSLRSYINIHILKKNYFSNASAKQINKLDKKTFQRK